LRREEKVEDAAETGGSGVFVVGCVWGLEVVEIGQPWSWKRLW